MSLVNEAEAVNAQRDAHMVGGSVLERRVRSLEEMRRGWSPESGGWGGADRDASRIATLERQRDALLQRGDACLAQAAKAETERDTARAEAARHAGRLIVACEERDTAIAALAAMTVERDNYLVQCEQEDAKLREAYTNLYNVQWWARIGSWLRGKAGR